MITMNQQIKIFNKDKKNCLNQLKILELNSLITKIKSSLNGFNRRFKIAKEITSELEHKEITYCQIWRLNGKMNSLRDLGQYQAFIYMKWECQEEWTRRDRRKNICRNNDWQFPKLDLKKHGSRHASSSTKPKHSRWKRVIPRQSPTKSLKD